ADADQTRPERHFQAVTHGLTVERRGEGLLEVAQAPAIASVQAVAGHPEQRGDLKGDKEQGKGQQAQQRQPFAAQGRHHARSSRQTGLSWATPSSSQTVPHNSSCLGWALGLRLKALPSTSSGTSRSSGSRPLWLRSLFMPWSAVTRTW